MTEPMPPSLAPELAALLPSSIAKDPVLLAAAKAVQPALDAVQPLVNIPALWSRIDELDEPVLRMLAWENRMLGAEWALAQTLEDKRNLVKNAYELNRKRGTRWAVERVFTLLRLRAEILEWWEEAPAAAPFTFRISVLDVGGRGILQSEFALIDELINAYKPLTRHNTGINLQLSVEGVVHVAGAVGFVMMLDIPASQIGGDIDANATTHAAGAVSFVMGM